MNIMTRFATLRNESLPRKHMWDVPMTWSRKFQLVAFVSLMFLGSPALAQEYQVACKFEPSTMNVTDPDAKPWHDDVSFRHRTFVMKLEPPEMVEGPAPQIFWGVPLIRVDVQEVRLEWQIKATPRERLPSIILIINRFSGEATEAFTMFAKPNQGPAYAYWWRHGRCEINAKKM